MDSISHLLTAQIYVAGIVFNLPKRRLLLYRGKHFPDAAVRHLLDGFPKFVSSRNDGCVPDGQPVAAQKIHIGPLIEDGGASRFVKDVAA